MITTDRLVSQTDGLARDDLDRWVQNDWVRPHKVGEHLHFAEIDVARVVLIHELRRDLEVNDATIPIVLSLIDQLYDLRRNVRQLTEILQDAVPDDLRVRIMRELVARNRKANATQ